MAGPSLTTQELDNIFKTYEHFGAEKLAEFIQAIWTEAYAEGRAKGAAMARYELRGTPIRDSWSDEP